MQNICELLEDHSDEEGRVAAMHVHYSKTKDSILSPAKKSKPAANNQVVADLELPSVTSRLSSEQQMKNGRLYYTELQTIEKTMKCGVDVGRVHAIRIQFNSMKQDLHHQL